MTAKVDANGQRTEYSYDSYNRPTQIRHLPNGVTEDLCQRVDLTYDSNGIGGFNYMAGRLATRAYATCQSPDGTNPMRTDFTDMFSYTQAGQVAMKRLRVSRTVSNQANQPVTVYRDLDASWAYIARANLQAAVESAVRALNLQDFSGHPGPILIDTILHEFGHVFALLASRSSGGSMIVPDDDTGAQDKNATTLLRCKF